MKGENRTVILHTFIADVELPQADQDLVQLVIASSRDLNTTKCLDTRYVAAIGKLHMTLCARAQIFEKNIWYRRQLTSEIGFMWWLFWAKRAVGLYRRGNIHLADLMMAISRAERLTRRFINQKQGINLKDPKKNIMEENKTRLNFTIPVELSQADKDLVQLVIAGSRDLNTTKCLDTRYVAAIGKLHMTLCAYVLKETCFCIDAAGILQKGFAKSLSEEYQQHRSGGVLGPHSGAGETNGA